MVAARQMFYQSRPERNSFETSQISLTNASKPLLAEQAIAEASAALLHLIPDLKSGTPTTIGATYGGSNVAPAAHAFGASVGSRASFFNTAASLNATLGSFERRQDDWDHQADLATRELEQVEKQIAGAQIRVAMAEAELRNHDLQIDNAAAMDDVMRNKFTNQSLYQWMIGQVSGVYFQSYQLAYDLAKRAERCLQHELGLAYDETSYIRFGYWHSLKKGLLAGELLSQDLRRLDAAYLDRNVREYELTKHISLVSLAPAQLIALKETGSCTFEVPEWLFDLDTPGHYRRRLKTVSVTIPCVVGPYVTVHCKVQLIQSSYRHSDDLTPGYERAPPGTVDNRFVDNRGVVSAMVTSTAQNDAGLFEPSTSDERYLPFEGAGAISTWQLELPNDYRSFDYATITDVILHLRYTSKDEDSLRTAAITAVRERISNTSAAPLLRLFSLRHEFPNEWYRFMSGTSTIGSFITVDLKKDRFPYWVQNRSISIREATVVGRVDSGPPPGLAVAPGSTQPASTGSSWTGTAEPGPWSVSVSSETAILADVFLIVAYTA